jgi:hypothetical protein
VKIILTLIFVSGLFKALIIAAPIPDLFNTGIDNFGRLLPDGATDPHYQLVSSPDKIYTGPDAKIVLSEGFPMNPWVLNTSTSKWIAPRTDAGTENYNEVGVYVYRIVFDLTTFKSNTAIITGLWSTDNDGVDILINGKKTGNETPLWAYFNFFPFEINQGFTDGLNTIDFVVYNVNGPTGLRVEITGRAEPKEYVSTMSNEQ